MHGFWAPSDMVRILSSMSRTLGRETGKRWPSRRSSLVCYNRLPSILTLILLTLVKLGLSSLDMSPPAVDQPPIHLFDHTKPPTSNPGRQRHLSNVRKYGSPLPILLQTQPIKSSQSQSFLSSYLPSIFSPSHAIESPRSTGIYHPLTRSVIVTGKDDIEILFRRGFFGKGTLSRSEPTWRDRRLDAVRGGSSAFGVLLWGGGGGDEALGDTDGGRQMRRQRRSGKSGDWRGRHSRLSVHRQ